MCLLTSLPSNSLPPLLGHAALLLPPPWLFCLNARTDELRNLKQSQRLKKKWLFLFTFGFLSCLLFRCDKLQGDNQFPFVLSKSWRWHNRGCLFEKTKKKKKKLICTHANVLTWKLKPVNIWDNICNSQALFFIANQYCCFDLNWLTFGLLTLVCNVLFIILAACWSHHFVRSPAQATAFIQIHWSTGQ